MTAEQDTRDQTRPQDSDPLQDAGDTTIRHPLWGCLIVGTLPGPLTVKHGDDVVGVANDMSEAVAMAKQQWRSSASIFDDVPRTWGRGSH